MGRPATRHAGPHRAVRRQALHIATAALLGGLGFAPITPAAAAWDAGAMRLAAERLGPRAVAALGPLQSLLLENQGKDEMQRVAAVNRFVNQQVVFTPDTETWAQEDYWASPLQTLGQGRGDCEDHVIAKYAMLLALQVPVQRLRLVYVRARLSAQTVAAPHMVLTYTLAPGAEPLVLDNLRGEVLPASRRGDLVPVFSFNSAGLWHGIDGATAGDPMARLSRWRDVWQRTRLEGFP